MYEKAVKAIRGLTPGSASAWERMADMLAHTPDLYQNGRANFTQIANNNSVDDSTTTNNSTSSTVTIDQWNLNSDAWALNVRNGDANFNGRIYGVIRPATATSDWVDASPTPYVDTTDDLDGRVVRVYLPRTRSGDPNVKSGAPVEYAIERRRTGRAVCVSSYMDDKINTVKLWKGDAGSVPSGWRISTNIGGNDPRGRFVANLSSGDVDFGTLGQIGGERTHVHDDHHPTIYTAEVVVDAYFDGCDLMTCTQQICYMGAPNARGTECG